MKQIFLMMWLMLGGVLGLGAQTDSSTDMRAAVKDIIDASQLYENVTQNIVVSLSPNRSALGLTEAGLADFSRRVVKRLEPRLLDAFVDIYTKHFTTKEAQQVAAFYRTPTGTKLARNMITVAGETGVAQQAIATGVGEAVKEYVNGGQKEGATEELADDYAREVERLLAEQGFDKAFRDGILLGLQAPSMNIPADRREPLTDYAIRRTHNALVNRVAGIYRKYYTIEDIRSQTVFFSQPLGKKMARLTTEIAAGLSRALIGIEKDIQEVWTEMKGDGNGE